MSKEVEPSCSCHFFLASVCYLCEFSSTSWAVCDYLYNMFQQEKKDRVIFLFEQELSEVWNGELGTAPILDPVAGWFWLFSFAF